MKCWGTGGGKTYQGWRLIIVGFNILIVVRLGLGLGLAWGLDNNLHVGARVLCMVVIQIRSRETFSCVVSYTFDSFMVTYIRFVYGDIYSFRLWWHVFVSFMAAYTHVQIPIHVWWLAVIQNRFVHGGNADLLHISSFFALWRIFKISVRTS